MLKIKNIVLTGTVISSLIFAAGCVKNSTGISENKTPNTQTFSTSQTISATINYSNSKGKVLFHIYDKNPLVSAGDAADSVNTNIPALDAAYTNDKGVFSGKLHLPAYAETVYIVADTPNGARLMKGSISNGNLSVTDKENAVEAVSLLSTKATRYAYNANRFAVLGWHDVLGTYDDHTGIVNYKNLPGATLTSTTDVTTLVNIANSTMNIDKTLGEIYRTQEDLLTAADNTEITMMVIMGSTCWNSPIGYYYYQNGHQPAKLADTKVYTMVPNSQIKWSSGNLESYPQALWIGDYIQLKYYGLDGTEAGTTKFPKDIRIGFVLATNMWNTYITGFPGDTYTNNGKVFYACSTPATPDTGFSTKRKTQTAMFRDENYPNDIIVGFEDHFNDQNFDDIVFALTSNPAITNVPIVNSTGTLATLERSGFYAFEDLWPKSGDFDMNDVMADYKYTKYFNNSNKIVKETFSFTLYQNAASYQDGLGLMFDSVPTGATITATKNGASLNATKEQGGQVVLLTDNVKSDMGSTFIVTVDYGSGSTKDVTDESTINPFIYRSESMLPGITATAGKRWEVHLPMKVPTDLVDPVYFGTNQDCSVPASNIYYVLNLGGYYPFAFYLENATISDMAPLLNKSNESAEISLLYPYFSAWARDNSVHKDWYKTTR
jgi:LruC domain-containing protein